MVKAPRNSDAGPPRQGRAARAIFRPCLELRPNLLILNHRFLETARLQRTMSRALLIPEIALAVVQELGSSGEGEQPPAKAVLIALARTCRALSEPALDVLWAEPQLWDLAVLMPADIWKIEEEGEGHSHRATLVSALPSPSRARACTLTYPCFPGALCTFCRHHGMRYGRAIPFLCQTCAFPLCRRPKHPPQMGFTVGPRTLGGNPSRCLSTLP
jgi:hypothetical protein